MQKENMQKVKPTLVKGASPRIYPREDQVFLIMGIHAEQETAECAIVMAASLAQAKAAYGRRYPGYQAMTWPSLREIRFSVDMMETARDGGFPDEVAVIDDMRRRD